MRWRMLLTHGAPKWIGKRVCGGQLSLEGQTCRGVHLIRYNMKGNGEVGHKFGPVNEVLHVCLHD